MALLLGIDLGGTNCRAAVADATSGVILAQARATLAPGASSDGTLEPLLNLFDRLWQQAAGTAGRPAELAAAGVAVPGVVDERSGAVSVLSNLGPPRRVPLRDLLRRRWGVPVWLENDVRAGAMGELAGGWGREFRTFLFVGLGTGTSAAAVIGGQPWRGAHGQAGEIAFALTGREYLGKDFGEHGCLETWASGYGIARAYGSNDGARAVFAAAEQGDARARAVIEAAYDHWVIGLSGAVTTLDPEAIVLGGGIGLRPDVREALAQRLEQALPLFPVRVVTARLGADAQLAGALNGCQRLLEGKE